MGNNQMQEVRWNPLDTSMNNCQERVANDHVFQILLKFLNNTLWWLPKQGKDSMDYE